MNMQAIPHIGVYSDSYDFINVTNVYRSNDEGLLFSSLPIWGQKAIKNFIEKNNWSSVNYEVMLITSNAYSFREKYFEELK